MSSRIEIDFQQKQIVHFFPMKLIPKVFLSVHCSVAINGQPKQIYRQCTTVSGEETVFLEEKSRN